MFDEHHAAIRSSLRRVAIVEVDDSGDQQRLTLTGLAGEEFKKVVRLHDYGFASNAPKGGEGVLLPQGGRSDRAWAMGFEHGDYRQKDLPVGAAALYDSAGNVIRMFGKDGVTFKFDENSWSATAKDVTVTSKEGQITIEAKSDHIVVNPNGSNVYIGGGSGEGEKVLTVAGPAKNVFAKV